jgi:hypothetical protein
VRELTWPEAEPTPSRALRRTEKLRGGLGFLAELSLAKSESMSSTTTIVSSGSRGLPDYSRKKSLSPAVSTWGRRRGESGRGPDSA